MDGRTEGRTDKWREGQREKASCRVVCPQLKTRNLDTLFRPPSLAKNTPVAPPKPQAAFLKSPEKIILGRR